MATATDVIAVMDRVSAGKEAYAGQLDEARAAVAELIEADKALQFIRNNGCDAAAYDEAVRRHDTALARVIGGAE